jgi:serine protease AprX
MWASDWLPRTVQPTGKGVGIALIDTGVAPVPGLTTGNVVNGPDLSFDSQDPAKRYIDGYGHGSHMAGIISARTPDLTGLHPTPS